MRLWLYILLMAMTVLPLKAQARLAAPQPVIADPGSDSLPPLCASLLVASEGEAEYSAVGHAALRMEFPKEGLDYCFSYDTGTGLFNSLLFFLGRAGGRFIAVSTADYMSEYEKEGRGITAYSLNLSYKEKQTLWRNLDNAIQETGIFDMFNSSCTSMCMSMIERSLTEEYLDYGNISQGIAAALTDAGRTLPKSLESGESGSMTCSEVMRTALSANPWRVLFWDFTCGGTDAQGMMPGGSYPPNIMPMTLPQVTIVGTDGSSRPLVLNDKVVLRPRPSASPVPSQALSSVISPLVVSIVILLLTVLITVANLRGKLLSAGKAADVVLMALQTLLGLWLTLLLFSKHAMTHWNCYLVVFNVIPLLLWAVARHRKWYPKVFGLYAAVLLIFFILTPVIPSAQWPLQLLLLSMFTRCLYNYHYS